MGAVAIWSMHFIGNRAITMEEGQPDLQIGYSPGFTAGSFFLPICAVGIAFYLFTVSEEVTIIGTIAGGCLSGFAICGMHYLGQGGISNYQAVYDWKYVFGSAIIAVVAATLALGIFFYFKSAWTNSWWKRMTCAFMLALGVAGMHWIATVGTSYYLKTTTGVNQDGMSRQTTVVVVMCLVRYLSLRPWYNLLTFAGRRMLYRAFRLRSNRSTESSEICQSRSAGRASVLHMGSGRETAGKSRRPVTVPEDNEFIC